MGYGNGITPLFDESLDKPKGRDNLSNAITMIQITAMTQDGVQVEDSPGK